MTTKTTVKTNLAFLIFVPKENSAKKKDATGVFHVEAKALLGMCSQSSSRSCSRIVMIDNDKTMQTRRLQVLSVLNEEMKLGNTFDGIVFLCHGWRDGIQLGFTKASAKALSLAIMGVSNICPIVGLYCCSTGGDLVANDEGMGENSFADTLRDELCRAGAVRCRVVAHKTKGHATRNPYVIFFDGMGSSVGGVGGFALVQPKTKAWSAWREKLKGSLRFEMLWLTVEEIHGRLKPPRFSRKKSPVIAKDH